MSEPRGSIRLEKDAYRPAELLAGAFQITGDPLERYTIELSVLWRTEGKGDEDLGVILFQEWTQGEVPFDFRAPQEFTVELPRSPLSYDGVLVKIHWLARVRLRWPSESEVIAEEPFRLGPVRAVAS
jgi:hypothetical protein